MPRTLVPILFLLAFLAIQTSAQQTCQNGIREGTEQCDDGNSFNGDGCSTTCQLEDPTGTIFTCVTDMAALSSCCRTLINPVTTQAVCTCAGQASDNPGYTITPDCTKRDIDECAGSGPSVCHDNAVCQNLDATQPASGMYNCVCPPGMLGDGVSRCDMFIYSSKLKVSVIGTLPGSFNTEAFIDNLYSWSVVPAYITRDRIQVTVGSFSTPVTGNRRRNRRLLEAEDNANDDGDERSIDSDATDNSDSDNNKNETETETPTTVARHLLGRRAQRPSSAAHATTTGTVSHIRQTGGTLVTVAIDSGSEDQMQNTTTAINVANIPTGGVYAVTQPPVSEISVSDTAFAPVSTVLTGFMVDSVVYNSAQYQWVVTTRYVTESPNTITGLYVSRVGAAPYSTQTLNNFYVSQNPCVRSSSVCCLNDLKTNYYTGVLADTITSTIGVCDAGVQAQQTIGMFDPSNNQNYVDGIFNGFPESSVVRLSDGSVQLLIAETDLRYNFSVRETLGPETPGYRLKFFVGMGYFTLLPANAISTTASQTQINVVVTNTLTFSFASQQDYTFVQYITLSLFQNKWVDGIMERQMQFAKVGVVLPSFLTQNMNTGLVPLGSIRFAIAKSLPEISDQSKWTNPCYSKTQTGMWDAGQPWAAMFADAAAQPCAMQSTMCMNQAAQVLSSNLVELYFPIGDGKIGTLELTVGAGFNLYVYFDLSAVDSSGRNVVTRLFAQAPITTLSLSRSCESLQATLDLLSTTQVDLTVGLVGHSSDWDTSVYEYDNVRQASLSNGLLDTTNKTALSIESGLITLIVRGDPNVFASSLTSNYFLEIEHLTTIHFLDSSKFDTVNALLQSNGAYTVLKDSQADFMSIQLSQAVSSACSAGGQSGALSCVVRHDIVARTVRNPWAVYPFATGVSTTNDTMTRDWITNNLLGVSEFSEDLAANMTSLVRSKFSINDRINRAWYINPGHKWPTVPGAPAQSVLLLSDRLIAIAVVSLRDGGGNIVRRRLMSTTYQSTHKKHNTRALLQDTSTITPTMVQVPRTTEEMVQAAMNSISNSPIAEAMPPISYGINVPNTLAKIVGVSEKPHDVIRVSMKALFPVDQTDNQVNIAIATRLRNNLARYCPTCDGVFPVFYGIKRKPASGTRRRNLLQFGLDSFDGDVDIVFSYMQGTANQVLFAELFRALLSDSYSATALQPGSSIEAFVNNIASGQIVATAVASTWNAQNTTYVVENIFASPDITPPPAIFDNSSGTGVVAATTPAPTTPPPKTNTTTMAELRMMADIMSSPASRLRNDIDSFFFAIVFIMASLVIY